MAVQIIKKSPNCKFCKHERSDDINALLDRHHFKEKGPDGKLLTLRTVYEILTSWGIDNVNRENYLSHRKHIRFVDDETRHAQIAAGTQDDEDWIEAQKRVLARAGERTGDVADRVVETQLLIFEEWTNIQLKRGTIKPGTLDQVKGLIGEKTKRKSSDAQDELLKALGGGIGMVFEKALSSGADPDGRSHSSGELPPAREDVIEGEVVDEDRDSSGADH